VATKLETLAKRIAKLADPGDRASFHAIASTAFAAESLKLIDDGFYKSRDPYGKPWTPLTSRQGKPLTDTGRMAAAFNARVTPTGYVINVLVRNNDPKYDANIVATHQYGATIRPKYAKALRFAVRGPSTKSNKRGKQSWVVTKKVVIPRRTMVPEPQFGGWGPIWTKALNVEADGIMRDFMGRP
jgi:hypothetical protein